MRFVQKKHPQIVLTKQPFEERELQTALEMALHKHKAERERAKLLHDEHEQLEKTLEGTVKVLGKILSVIEPQSYELGQKIKELVSLCAEFLKLDHAWELGTAATLARIGYATIPAVLIQKMRAGMTLAPTERDILLSVPEAGRNLLMNFSRLEPVARMVYYQSKNFDGTGFPLDSVGGVNIPLGGRLLKILGDLIQFEADGTPKGRALDKMKTTSGVYDPKLLVDVSTALASGPKKGRAVLLKDLLVGQVLVEAIETPEGTLVLGEGNTISPWMLKKLHNFVQVSGIKEPIYVEG